MKSFDLLGFVAHLGALERDMHTLGPMILEKAAAMVCAEARRVLGTHDYDWPELKPETIADRVKQGFTPNDPGLRSGAMRDSIEYTIAHHGLEAEIGSDDQHLVWFELGTAKQPPRSVLVAAAQHMGPKIEKMAARAVVAVMAGRGLHSTEMRELLEILKLAKEVAHQVKKDLVDPMFPDEEERRRK